jgi:hypothetical protein
MSEKINFVDISFKLTQTHQKSGGKFMKSPLFFLFVFVALGVIFPSNTMACACCAEPGTYMIWTGKASEYELGLLGEMTFDNKAALFMTEAGFDGMKGLESIEKDYESESWTASPGEFNLANSFAAKTWKFNFKTPTGKLGILTLPMPLQMLQFKVDIHDNSDTGLGPILYKEWRFKGTVTSGTGIFKSSIIRPTSYFLVFQGRGNGCDNAEDFTHWRLEVTGRKADYAFFGKLNSGVSSYTDEAEN